MLAMDSAMGIEEKTITKFGIVLRALGWEGWSSRMLFRWWVVDFRGRRVDLGAVGEDEKRRRDWMDVEFGRLFGDGGGLKIEMYRCWKPCPWKMHGRGERKEK
jgi:hypothetical protein